VSGEALAPPGESTLSQTSFESSIVRAAGCLELSAHVLASRLLVFV